MSERMKTWKALARPPISALKQIQAGRLKGKSDINPQWRYQALTEQFGVCGDGWKFEVVRLWTEQAPENAVFAFANVNLYHRLSSGEWSAPIPGIGGSMLVEKERSGLHANDEAFKMAVTDALGTAAKMLGVAAEIYLGNFDGSKYRGTEEPGLISEEQLHSLRDLVAATESDEAKLCAWLKVPALEKCPADRYEAAAAALRKKAKS